MIPTLLERLEVRRTDGRVSFSREALLQCDPLVRARLIRALAAEAGVQLDARATDLAAEFVRSGGSGRSLDLPGGAVLSRSFGRLAISRPHERIHDRGARARFVAVPAPGEGVAGGRSGGATFLARWSTRSPVGGEGLSIRGVALPHSLSQLAARRPDSSRRGGTRKLKKVFGEARIPRPARARRPVVADSQGRILWVPGVARSIDALPEPQDAVLYVGVELDDATD